MLTMSTSPVVGMVDGCGYDGRQKDAICDVHVPNDLKHIWASLSLISTGHAYKLLRCLDVEIWQFHGDNRRTDG